MNERLRETQIPFAQADIMTPLGQMTVVLATQEEFNRLQFPGARPNFESLAVCITSGPVCDYLDGFGMEKNIILPREAREDSIPSVTALPNIKPMKLVLHDILMNSKNDTLFMAYGHIIYEQECQDGTVNLIEHSVYFRPDSAASLVVIIDSETKKQHLLLTRGMKDGAGGYFSGEAVAGSNDKEGEELKKLVLREMIEEIGLTQEELDTAQMKHVFEAFVSPGADVETVSGFQLVMMLTTDRIKELKSHIGGVHEEHETIQQILLELPSIPEKITLQTVNLYIEEWNLMMSVTKDLKTRALLEHFARTSIESLFRSVLT